jgi:hypothetical protein
MLQRLLDLVIGRRCIDDEIAITLGPECPDGIHGAIDVEERGDHTRSAPGLPSVLPALQQTHYPCPPRFRGMGIISLIS